MQPKKVVSREEWLEARKALLIKEKEFTRARDAISAARRDMPWEPVEEDYAFEGPDGSRSLSDLFDGREQLMIYHFMMGPGWEAGCPSCSFLADHFEPAIVHLAARDVTLVAVSRAPFAEIEAFRRRMGWTFGWLSSAGSSFNRDYGVSFSPEEIEGGEVWYNYGRTAFPMTEAPGLSVFARGDRGEIYHAYSTYGRGLDTFITAYHFLDHAPKGRDEQGLAYPMEWVRHRDRYGE